MRKRAEVENTGKNEATGPRKPKDILGNKVSVKVSKAFWSCAPPLIYSHPAAFSRGNMGGRGLFFPSAGTKGEVVEQDFACKINLFFIFYFSWQLQFK